MKRGGTLEYPRSYQRLALRDTSSIWPPPLRDGLARGEYVSPRVRGDWIVCFWADEERVRTRGAVAMRPRIAINLLNGQILHSPSDCNPIEWECKLTEQGADMGQSAGEDTSGKDLFELGPVVEKAPNDWIPLGERKGIRRRDL